MKEKILIADDNKFLVEILKADLELLNYEVYTAKDGEEALEIVQRVRPDLIILDIMMPKYNGYQVCRKIKNDPELKNTIIIILTAKTAPDDKYWGKDCGADEYVTKPFDTNELENLIRKKLDDYKKGKITHPITGLPTIEYFNKERDKRYKNNLKFVVLRFFYKDNCLEDIETILGKFCYADILSNTAKFLAKFSENLSEYDPFLGFSLDNCFYLMINVNKENALAIAKRSVNYLNNMLSAIDLSKSEPKVTFMEKKYPIIMMGCAMQLYNQQ